MKTYSTGPKRGETGIPVSCPVCAEHRIRPWADFGTYAFGQCIGCGHLYQNPMPAPADLERRYDSDYTAYEIENADRYLNLMLLGLRDLGFDSLERSMPAEKTFLDIGCATGALVEYMKRRSWRAEGLEICREAAEWGQHNRGVSIHCCTLEHAPIAEQSIHLIHSSHVIEHVGDPRAFVRRIRDLLAYGGYCVTVTPNSTSLQRLLRGPNWRSAIGDHVNLFSRSGLIRLHREAGLEPVKWVSWGGIPAGSAPAPLKKCVDTLIKKTPWGDVIALLCRKPLQAVLGSSQSGE